MLFFRRDIWRNGAFAHGGFIIAPSGLDQDGLLLKIMLVVDAEWLTQVLPGWRIKRGNVELKVFMGPEIQITTCGRTTRPIDCAATRTACALRPRFGASQPRRR